MAKIPLHSAHHFQDSLQTSLYNHMGHMCSIYSPFPDIPGKSAHHNHGWLPYYVQFHGQSRQIDWESEWIRLFRLQRLLDYLHRGNF